jgi:hypothetical protein
MEEKSGVMERGENFEGLQMAEDRHGVPQGCPN